MAMPNRYEREIEEILRNLEQTEPKPGLGQKFSRHLRRKPSPRMSTHQRRLISFQYSAPEWLLIIAVAAALISGGYAYFHQSGSTFTGLLATIGIVCLLLVALSQFVFRPRAPQSTRYGNITVTPLRRNPLSTLKTRWNLFLLKMRYRRKDED